LTTSTLLTNRNATDRHNGAKRHLAAGFIPVVRLLNPRMTAEK